MNFKKTKSEIEEVNEIIKLNKEMKYKFKKSKKQKKYHNDKSPYLYSPYYEEWSTLVNKNENKEIVKSEELYNEFTSIPDLYEYFIIALNYFIDHHYNKLTNDEIIQYQFVVDYLDYEHPSLETMIDHYLIHRLDLLKLPISFYVKNKRISTITTNEQIIINELVRGYAVLDFFIH